MSCGCSSTTTPSPSITCGSCGYQCTSCTCPVDPIVMPTVTCADPATCQEIYPLECVQYTGEDIKCSTEASSLYPNVTHIVATNGDMLPNILNNINNQLCYLFSTDFISSMLNVIQEDSALSDIFCGLSTACGSAPTALICPTVSYLTYNIGSIQNYLQAQFNYLPYATSYLYKFYVEDSAGSNTYTAVGSGTLPQPTTALPITISAVLSGTLLTISRKYIVLVQAIDSTSTYTSKGPNLSSTYTGATLTSVQYNAILAANLNYCGNNVYVQSTPTEQTCTLATLTGAFKGPNSNSYQLQFFFTQEPSNVLYIPIVNYTVHWYLKVTGPTINYVYQGYKTVSYVSNQAEVIDLYKLPVTITSGGLSKTGSTVTVTSTAHGLVSGMSIQIDTAITGIPAGAYTITVTNANTFYFVVGNSTSLGSSSLIYKSQMNPNTDSVVVMIYTNATSECFKGIEDTHQTYSSTQIATYTSNANYNVFKNFQ
jgi:hypothetical protein